jgi:hypothetical protein
MTSQINPNNIDGQYPVAGQDNNSQGFRDNFTNTKTNFEYAAEEITELQGNVILKTALTGTTLNNNMGNALISNVQLRGQTSTVVPGIGNVTNATATINFGAGSYQIATTQGNTQLAFTGWPSGAANLYGAVRLQLTTTAANANITVPASIGANTNASYTSLRYIIGRSASSNVITIANTGTYVFEFSSADGGSNVFIQDLTRGANATPTA